MKSILIILSITSIFTSCTKVDNLKKKEESSVNPKDSIDYAEASAGRFSEYRGTMSWEEAKQHCASIGMRIPTVNELELARKLGLYFKSFYHRDAYNGYWVFSDGGEERYNFSFVNGYVYKKNEDSDLSCIALPDKINKPLKTKETFTGEWSSYQGKMNWDDAKARCESLGMRLPQIVEIESSYKAGITQAWKKDGNNYWTSEEYEGFDRPISRIISNNYKQYFAYPCNAFGGNLGPFRKIALIHVRCIR